MIDWNSQSNYDNQFKNDYIDDADFPLVLKTDSKKNRGQNGYMRRPKMKLNG